MGTVKMLTSEFETNTKVIKTKNPSKVADSGGFVLWQMIPDMWYLELAVGGSKVHAGCNGKLVWRHSHWLGSHAAKGHVRPLRNALQVEFQPWLNNINSLLEDYRPVDGVMIARSGQTTVTLFRFGEVAMNHTKIRMEEVWMIEEVAFNFPGLSMDSFIPPTDIRCNPMSETRELPREDRGKSSVGNN